MLNHCDGIGRLSLSLTTLCAFILIGLLSSKAQAHMDFATDPDVDFECIGTYEKGCRFVFSELARRRVTVFFDGTNAQNGSLCGERSRLLNSELLKAEENLGITPGTIRIVSITKTVPSGFGPVGEKFRCSYFLESKRKDVRFAKRFFNRRFWTNEEEKNGLCQDDVAEARMKTNSVGAASWITASLAQGEICNTYYLEVGRDHLGPGAPSFGKPTPQVLKKFGVDKKFGD